MIDIGRFQKDWYTRMQFRPLTAFRHLSSLVEELLNGHRHLDHVQASAFRAVNCLHWNKWQLSS